MHEHFRVSPRRRYLTDDDLQRGALVLLLAALLTRTYAEVDNVVGVKQSADDMEMVADLLLLLRKRRGLVFSAVDALHTVVCAGRRRGDRRHPHRRITTVHGSVECSADQRPCDGSALRSSCVEMRC